MSIKVKGLKELQRSLKKMSNNIKKISGEREILIAELLEENFMRKHTRYDSFDEMIRYCPFKVETAEDFKAIPDDEWDIFIREVTDFESWEDMLGAAAIEYATKKMMEGL